MNVSKVAMQNKFIAKQANMNSFMLKALPSLVNDPCGAKKEILDKAESVLTKASRAFEAFLNELTGKIKKLRTDYAYVRALEYFIKGIDVDSSFVQGPLKKEHKLYTGANRLQNEHNSLKSDLDTARKNYDLALKDYNDCVSQNEPRKQRQEFRVLDPSKILVGDGARQVKSWEQEVPQIPQIKPDDCDAAFGKGALILSAAILTGLLTRDGKTTGMVTTGVALTVAPSSSEAAPKVPLTLAQTRAMNWKRDNPVIVNEKEYRVATIGGMRLLETEDSATYYVVTRDKDGRVVERKRVENVPVFKSLDGTRTFIFSSQAKTRAESAKTAGGSIDYYGGDGTLTIGFVDEVELFVQNGRGEKDMYLNPKGSLLEWFAEPEDNYSKVRDDVPVKKL